MNAINQKAFAKNRPYDITAVGLPLSSLAEGTPFLISDAEAHERHIMKKGIGDQVYVAKFPSLPIYQDEPFTLDDDTLVDIIEFKQRALQNA